jgi:hypothetical protein
MPAYHRVRTLHDDERILAHIARHAGWMGISVNELEDLVDDTIDSAILVVVRGQKDLD